MGSGCQHHGPHGHDSHSHSAQGQFRRLTITLVLVAVYCVAEIVGGFWTGSLALLADAGHMVSDMASLAISLFAIWMTRRRPTQQQTFGFYRAEILAALVNGSLLFLVAGGILHEAWERLQHPEPIQAGPMLWIALGGLLVNFISLGVLHGGRDENLNLRGAWLHVVGDTLGSVTVILAAFLIWQFGWIWADPVASVLACLLILYSAWHLVSDAVEILMEHAPRDVDVDKVRQQIMSVPGVRDVHCLHVWTIASGLRAVSAHVVFQKDDPKRDELQELQSLLRKSFDLKHITLQLEDVTMAACENQENGACLLSAPGQTHSHSHSH
ncbi:cation diffusion facilitator family transporter [Planctomicrobium sp. SH661]|uniref:cation diffusion facilitator family transporter n=1 Tax=Planctomicrobium sp. SH661 TaxID=3448124 RepID=UPI003F5B1F4B